MKKILFVLTLMLGCFVASNAQCGDELMKTALGSMGNYQYIKDFDVKLAAGAAKESCKFNVVLNSRTAYQINIANGATNADKVAIEIYDGDKVIGCNVKDGKVFEGFQFICSKTGAYKFVFYTLGGTEACARTVLSLVKQFPE